MGRRKGRPGPTGILWVDKPAGPSSAEVCDFLRWVLGTRAVGHCGTLDPDATGLLVCCVGAATKLVSFLVDEDKTYRGTIALGASTTTADAAGEIVETAPVPAAVWARIPGTLAALVGTHQLPPPAFSAVRIDGERAHVKARRGEAVVLPPRAMTVFEARDVELFPYEEPGPAAVSVTLRVSKGTFIRSLAEAVGAELGVPAHLAELHRVGSGRCSLDDARSLRDFSVAAMDPRPDGKPRHRLRLRGVEDDRAAQAAAVLAGMIAPIEALGFPVLDLRDAPEAADLARRLGHGQSIPQTHPALEGFSPEGLLSVTQGENLVIGRFHPAQSASSGGSILRVERTVVPLTVEPAAAP